MGKKYVLAVDQSTQGTKAMLFDEKGTALHRSDLPHRQYINEKGWVSHDLDEIYGNTLQAVRNLIEESGVSKEEIACLGISNQRETSAAWDRVTGKPLAMAVVWQCARAAGICRRVEQAGISEQIREKTGLHLSPYFPAAKYAWLQENVEAVGLAKKERRLCLGTIDSWLVFKLTGGKVFATDYSNASRTQLFDIHTGEWSKLLCSLFGISADCLPQVYDSNACFGRTDFEGLLPEPIPINSVLGDSHAALFGQGCHREGQVKTTMGTGSSIMMNIGREYRESKNGLATSLAWRIDGVTEYVLEGNINYAGAVISWLQKDLGLIQDPGETATAAKKSNPEDETVLVPAFSGLAAPWWTGEARAMFYGMSRTTTKNELIRAAVESIAYQITDILKAMAADSGIPITEVKTDGGPSKNPYLMQFLSEMGKSIVLASRDEELSAIGTAYMAGIAAGVYEKEAVFAHRDYTVYEPKMEEAEWKKRMDRWTRAVEMLLRN